MNKLRWKLFKVISWIGWKVCPQPQRREIMHIMARDGLRYGDPGMPT